MCIRDTLRGVSKRPGLVWDFTCAAIHSDIWSLPQSAVVSSSAAVAAVVSALSAKSRGERAPRGRLTAT
eukprot:2947271-Alexandrium_andersonii.AAC.1